ncbi:carotenoid biosynthesis protein [Holophaga foetida]|uniref:carotenoid biosynthesis protein n=1 Tax=Holophaga foetida TaxID=35839 RepID=UPI0002473797|nr:carotenoid biosynthesis protein [Holophaga foetida]
MKFSRHFDRHLERDIEYNPFLETVLIVVLAMLLAAHLGVLGWQMTLGKLPFQAMTYVFSLLVLVHAVYLTGWRRALAFFALALVVSFVMEYVGAKTGLIFGHYHYTDVLDPKIASTVPVVIPLAYFMVLYPSRMMADLITWGKAAGVTRGLLWSLFTAVLAALTMTAWDLSMDPVMVHDVRAWVWERGGPYFGIPLQNFFGWFLTTFIISFLGERLERYLPLLPLGRLHRTVIYLPLVGYGALCLGGPFVGIPVDTRVISPFTMAVPLLAASLRLFDSPDES